VTRWITIAAVVLLLYFGLRFLAAQSLFYPLKYPAGDWGARESLGARDVWVRDGLHGWFAGDRNLPYVSLHLHGNGGNITHRDLVARHVLQAGSSILLLDYRGYGRSSGKPTEAGLYEDGRAALDWLIAQGFTAEKIVLYGESLGTAVAIHLAAQQRCAGLILEAPFTSAQAVAGRVLPFIGQLLIGGFDNLSKIGDVRCPVFVIHGDRDEVISYDFGEQLFRAAPEPRRMWTVRGGQHNDLHLTGEREFVSRLRGFYESL
jgi:fermentation-respiration switch protein FrsA (DUF1100 family)